MMYDMKFNAVMKHVLADEAKFTINSGGRPLRNVHASGSNFGNLGCV